MEMVQSSARKDFKNIIAPCLENIDEAEILRNISHICKSDSSLQRTKNQLSQNPSRDDILGCLCEEVGDDTRPLISLLELMSVNENNETEIQKCIKELESYWNRKSSSLSQCEECSSPPITPTAALCFSALTLSFSAVHSSGPVEPSSISPDDSSSLQEHTPENQMQILPFCAEIQPSFDTF